MLAGKTFKAHRIKMGTTFTGSLTYSGDGTPKRQWNATLITYSIYNTVSLSDGISLSMGSSESTPSFSCVLNIPAFSISDTISVGAFVDPSDIRLDLVGVTVIETMFSPWRMFVDSVELIIDGSVVGTYSGGTLDANGLGPGYVPLIGIPPRVDGAVTIAIAGISPSATSYAYSYDYTATLTAYYGFQFEDGGDWYYMPVEVPTATLPDCFDVCTYCLSASGIVSGSTTEAVTLNLATSGVKTYFASGSDEFDEGTSDDTYGWFYLIPNLGRSVVKLGGSYGALIQRGGLPYAKYISSRACTTSDPAKLPPPPPPHTVPYTKTRSTTGNLLPSYSAYLGTVQESDSIIEDPLSDTVWLPYKVVRSKQYLKTLITGGGAPVETATGEIITYTFPSKVQHRTKYGDPNRGMLAYLSWDDGNASPTEINNIVTYLSYIVHPHWHYFYKNRDWDVDGASVAWDDYWVKLGDQWLSHPSLSEGDDIQKRTSMVSAPLLEGGNVDFVNTIAFGAKTSWWGVPRFDLDRPEIPAAVTASSDTTDRWTSDDATFAIDGVQLEVTSTGASVVTVDYAMADWDVFPRLAPLLTKSFELGWTADNIESVKVYALGVDDAEWLITATPGTFPWWVGLRNKKYAGTWAQDWGVGAVTDTGTDVPTGGDSTAQNADNIRVIGSQFLSARGCQTLRYVITLTDPGTPVLIDLPTFHLADAWRVYQESRQFASALAARGPCVRFGQSNFWNYLLDTFAYPPQALGPGSQTTVLDWLCWRRVVLQGIDATDGLLTQLNGLYILGTEWNTLIHIAYDTTAWMATYGTHGDQLQGVLCNTFQPPPLAMLPTWDRDDHLTKTTTLCQKVWAFDQLNRYHIVPKVTSDNEKLTPTSGGTDWLSTVTSEPEGWTVRSHQHVVDNTETDYWLTALGRRFASVRPWHGYFWVTRQGITGNLLDYAVSRGQRHSIGFESDGTIKLAHASNQDLGFTEVDTGQTWDQIRIAYAHGGPLDRLWALWLDGGTFYRGYTEDQGASFTMATNLGSGSQGDHCWHVNNLHHCYRMDGGTVYVRRFDLEGNEIGSEQPTNLTGLDDAPIQIEPSVDGDGNARIVALVMASGDVHTYVSTDSINFY